MWTHEFQLFCVLTRVGKKYFSAELTDFQVKDNVIAYTFLTCFFLDPACHLYEIFLISSGKEKHFFSSVLCLRPLFLFSLFPCQFHALWRILIVSGFLVNSTKSGMATIIIAEGLMCQWTARALGLIPDKGIFPNVPQENPEI